MKVVISTNPDRAHWLRDIRATIPDLPEWDVLVVNQRGFELGAIEHAYKVGYQRFLFLQDSVIIKNPAGFMHSLGNYVTSSLMARPSCYMFVYDRRVLERMKFPPPIAPDDKETSIRYETEFCDEYISMARHLGLLINGNMPIIFPELNDARALQENNIQVVHGEKRLILENEFMAKRKGTYR